MNKKFSKIGKKEVNSALVSQIINQLFEYAESNRVTTKTGLSELMTGWNLVRMGDAQYRK